MAYIKNNTSHNIGDWVITTRVHSSMRGTFTTGSKVRITGIDPIRGYNIEDAEGNEMYEIGWTL